MRVKGFFTASEIAKILRVTGPTVQGYIEKGSIRAYRLGGTGKWRIPEESLEDFLRASGITKADIED